MSDNQPEDKPSDPPPPYTPNTAANPPYPTSQPPYPPTAYPPTAYPPTAYPPTSTAYPPPGAAYSAPYNPYPATGYAQTTTTSTVVQGGQQSTTVVVTGRACPTCNNGFLVEQFTCCGIMMAILFFPIGILCCLAMRIRVCSNCGSAFG